MATAAKFPTAALALTDVFGELPNFPPLTLNGAINASVTSIVVNEAIPATWPQLSWITVDQEVMRVTSYNAGSKTFTVAARDASAGNAQSTTAASHTSGAYLFIALTAQQWNQAIAEIIAIETHQGLDQVNNWPWYWTPGMAIESTVTGTGAYTNPAGFVHGQLSCGATSGSNVGLRMTVSGIFGSGNSGTNDVRYWAFAMATDKAANEAWRIFLTDESVTGQPSLTARHLGVRFDGTTVNFSTADNTTEQTTDVTAQFTANTTAHCVITFDGTTAKLYIDGTLRATHATNVPTAAAGVLCIFRAHITNSAAADKLMYLASMQVRGLA